MSAQKIRVRIHFLFSSHAEGEKVVALLNPHRYALPKGEGR